MILVIENHYGYGLRKDEEPFAHKIPPGGNWKSLPIEDQLVFWNGRIPKDGGSANGLRRRRWDEPAGTITTTPLQKLSCQLHPGKGGSMQYREFNVTPTQPPNGFTMVELFCGGGLMAVGLKEAGFNIIWAVDKDKRAVQAYKKNLGDHVVLADITEINPEDIPNSDIIAGGPPCQDFSLAGKGEGEKGERGKLVWTYLNIIEKKQPKAFIFENVKGLITKKHLPTFEALIQKFDEIGYTVSWKLINAWDYGVAQKRERVFIVGIRKDLGFKYEFPEPKTEDYRTQVLRDVIGDLPEPKDAHLQNHDPKRVPDKPAPTLTAHLAKGAPDGLYFPNHEATPLSKSDEEIAKYVPNGGNWKDVPYEQLPDRLKRVRNNLKDYKSPAFYKKASLDEPAGTISATMNPTHCQALAPDKVSNHNEKSYWTPPTQPRRFTVRECLRIQSAPDWYVLPDGISLSAQYRIVGNGVPCRVAWYLGIALAKQLKEHIDDEERTTTKESETTYQESGHRWPESGLVASY